MTAAVSLLTVKQLSVSGVVTGCVYGLIALGLSVIFNATGLINFAQGAFVVLGGFLLYNTTQTWGLPLIPAVLITIVMTAALGALVELVVIRLRRGGGGEDRLIGSGMALLAVVYLLTAAADWIWGVNPLAVPEFTSGNSFNLAGAVITQQQVWVVGVTIVVVVLFALFFQRTTLGIAMRASALNADAARGVGISVKRMSLIAFALGCGLAVIAGILITPITGTSSGDSLTFVVYGFSAALLGGLGDSRGAIVGGVALGLIESVSGAFISSNWQTALPMVVMILVFLVRPGGILGVGMASRV